MRSILLPTLALLLTGCLSYKQVVMHDIADVEVRKLDLKGVELTAHVRLENPNGYRIHVKDPDVDLYLNGTFVGKGMLDSTLVLDKRSSRIYVIPLHAEFKGANLLMMLLGGALTGEMKIGAKGSFVGQAGLLRKRFPFEVEQTVDMRR
jgi:LEA14-like dessication related protein